LADEIDLSVEDNVNLLYFTITQLYGAFAQGARPGTNEVICQQLVDGQDAPLEAMAAIFRAVTLIFRHHSSTISSNNVFAVHINSHIAYGC
jgi:hypothetical protein